MSSNNRRRDQRKLFAFATACVAAIAALAMAASLASAGTIFPTPPGGVYTCAWISANPQAAAAAQVTCDPAVFFSAASGSATTSQGASSVRPLSSGCQYLPTTGAVGKGVFAWTGYKSAVTNWNWSGLNGAPNYTWYVQTTGGTYAHGDLFDDNNHNVGVPSNTYRWGAQNHSDAAQQWFVCWS